MGIFDQKVKDRGNIIRKSDKKEKKTNLYIPRAHAMKRRCTGVVGGAQVLGGAQGLSLCETGANCGLVGEQTSEDEHLTDTHNQHQHSLANAPQLYSLIQIFCKGSPCDKGDEVEFTWYLIA